MIIFAEGLSDKWLFPTNIYLLKLYKKVWNMFKVKTEESNESIFQWSEHC